jgi:hypothetical protein
MESSEASRPIWTAAVRVLDAGRVTSIAIDRFEEDPAGRGLDRYPTHAMFGYLGVTQLKATGRS